MNDRPGSLSRVRTSEDKVRRKKLVLVCVDSLEVIESFRGSRPGHGVARVLHL
jgi:hypothetical protein